MSAWASGGQLPCCRPSPAACNLPAPERSARGVAHASACRPRTFLPAAQPPAARLPGTLPRAPPHSHPPSPPSTLSTLSWWCPRSTQLPEWTHAASLPPHHPLQVNYQMDPLPDWRQLYFGPNYARLSAIKAAYDPAGLFDKPYTVQPPGGSQRRR